MNHPPDSYSPAIAEFIMPFGVELNRGIVLRIGPKRKFDVIVVPFSTVIKFFREVVSLFQGDPGGFVVLRGPVGMADIDQLSCPV